MKRLILAGVVAASAAIVVRAYLVNDKAFLKKAICASGAAIAYSVGMSFHRPKKSEESVAKPDLPS
jgi:hypothetical protein